jgi:hypothetical protein
MNAVRFTSTCFVTMILLVLCAVVFEPTRQMLVKYNAESFGPGVLPAVSLGGVSLFAVFTFFAELRTFLRSRAAAGDSTSQEEEFGMPLRKLLSSSFTIMIFLLIYIILWQTVSFLVATIAFTISMSISALPSGEKTGKRIVHCVFVLGIFSIATWAVFTYLLKVNLQ